MKSKAGRAVPIRMKVAAEVARRLPQQIARAGWVLLLLVGCGTYNPPPSGTLAPPATAVSPVAGSVQTEISPAPGSVQTEVSPVTGLVQFEQGPCCIAGTAGSTIQLTARFSATSPAGMISDMRVGALGGKCLAQPSVDATAWEPFAPSKTFTVPVAINWTTFSLSAQFRDDRGNVSPIYCAEIAVEGMPAVPAVNPADWYPQIQCFSEQDVHPAQGEIVTDTPTTFRWPDKNQLPDGVFYKVNVYGAADQYAALIASGQTRDTSLRLEIPRDRAGDIVWYITLVDANGTFLDHGRCSSFAPSLLTVNPPSGIKGVHFTYHP